jgi:gliding motility-associated-like protein
VTEKDNIQELFSKAFENQTASVRPELWQGVQSKMAAAGMATGSTAVVKGVSVLTKWIIGTAAVGAIAVTTYVLTAKEDAPKDAPQKQETSVVSQTIQQEQGDTKPNTYKETENASDETQVSPAPVFDPSFDNSVDEINMHTPQVVEPNVHVVTPTKTEPAAPQKTDKPLDVKTDTKAPVQVAPVNNEEPANTVLAAKLTHFPNVFTPNNDGNNDLYSVTVENEESIEVFLVQIYNEKNQLVYSSPDPHFSWNGEYQGEVNAGMYFCLVTIVDKAGKTTKDKQLLEIRK